MSMNKINVAVIGASGYVGQRFVSLLQNHPYFNLKKLIASERSDGLSFSEAIFNREVPGLNFDKDVLDMKIISSKRIDEYTQDIDLVFCAVDMPKEEIIKLETSLAQRELVVVSNNSAMRKFNDVPMIIPEINNKHLDIIEVQKKRLGSKKGFVTCKPNCSIQSYVPILSALIPYGLREISVATYQAISGAGKTFKSWPEMNENLIPFISGEEEKTEQEPLKIWGKISDKGIINNNEINISAHCFRVPVQEGHTAAVSFNMKNKLSKDDLLKIIKDFSDKSVCKGLPTAPENFIVYHDESDRPQVKLDCNSDKGMSIHFARLREDNLFDWKFTGLSHNTLRGAAGGAVLTAEYLYKNSYL